MESGNKTIPHCCQWRHEKSELSPLPSNNEEPCPTWVLVTTKWQIGKDPNAGKDWRQKEKRRQRMRWLDNITNIVNRSLSKLWDILKDWEVWLAAVHGLSRGQTQLSHWTRTAAFSLHFSGKFLLHFLSYIYILFLNMILHVTVALVLVCFQCIFY